MSPLEKVRYHLAQCEPQTVAEVHLRLALQALLEELELFERHSGLIDLRDEAKVLGRMDAACDGPLL